MRRCEVCFAPLPPWAEAYLWPCVRGGLTVCADCFDTLVGGLSRRELAARLGITTRSANRIIVQLEESGCITTVGKRSAGKGRPARVIKITLPESLSSE